MKRFWGGNDTKNTVAIHTEKEYNEAYFFPSRFCGRYLNYTGKREELQQ
jgi:hypothetical protein